mgnify:CR=1 FL=1
MLSGAIHIIEFVLYIYFAVCVGYIVIFSVASCFFKSQQYPQSHDFKRFAILIPAYKEDNYSKHTLNSYMTSLSSLTEWTMQPTICSIWSHASLY